jgi:hypothetical protein
MLTGCGRGHPGSPGSGNGAGDGDIQGTVRAVSLVPDDVNIKGISFNITGAGGAMYAKTVPLMRGPVDATKPELASRLFADWLLVLPPGPYHVTATPLETSRSWPG